VNSAPPEKNRKGKVVFKSRYAQGQQAKTRTSRSRYPGKFWHVRVQEARKSLGIKGFQVIGGRTARGQALLKKAR
jgi:hypothetical protein